MVLQSTIYKDSDLTEEKRGRQGSAAGITGIARTAGAAAGTALAAPLVAAPLLGGGLPFVIAGSVKIVYDLTLWRRFRSRPAIDAGEPAQSGS